VPSARPGAPQADAAAIPYGWQQIVVGLAAVTVPVGVEVLGMHPPTDWRATIADKVWKFDVSSQVPWAGMPKGFPVQLGASHKRAPPMQPAFCHGPHVQAVQVLLSMKLPFGSRRYWIGKPEGQGVAEAEPTQYLVPVGTHAPPLVQAGGVPHTVAVWLSSPGMPTVGASLHGVEVLKLGVKVALPRGTGIMLQVLLTR
jgi:hypothetical protein